MLQPELRISMCIAMLLRYADRHDTSTGSEGFAEPSLTIAQLGVQYGHMGYYFITVAFMLVTVMLLSCCVPYYVVLLLDVMFVHVLHLSCLVCMYPNCFVAFPLYILVHGCPCFL